MAGGNDRLNHEFYLGDRHVKLEVYADERGALRYDVVGGRPGQKGFFLSYLGKSVLEENPNSIITRAETDFKKRHATPPV